MITDKINALFNLVEFLHSNISNFKKYDSLINELYSLDIERNKLNPRNNFTDKLRNDEIKIKIKDKFDVIDKKIIQIIKSKVIELDVCDWNETDTLWNFYILEISELKENFEQNDIQIILKHKKKYIEFRTKTNCDYFQTFFFRDLDKILKVLFDFFKESEQNEFEAFETKTIKVNNIQEAVKLLIPTLKSESIQRLSKSLSDINYFQIYFETSNKKEYNNDSILRPENWDNLKDIFFTQRMEKYKSSYTQSEKIKLELEDLENLTINKTDYKILKNRYKDFLNILLLQEINANKLSDVVKEQILKNNLFYYSSSYFNKDNLKGIFNLEYQTTEDFLKILYSENTRIFFRYLITLKNEAFVNSINNEFKLFCTYNNATNQIKENWLKHTYSYIVNANEISGFISKTTVCLFIDWYNDVINTFKENNDYLTPKAEAIYLHKTSIQNDKDLTVQKWFATGIALATGEAFQIYKKLGANSPTEICRKLKVDTSNKTYISATINNYDSSKNLFKDKKKLIALHKYITDHQLNFGAEFLEKHNQIEPD